MPSRQRNMLIISTVLAVVVVVLSLWSILAGGSSWFAWLGVVCFTIVAVANVVVLRRQRNTAA